MPKNDRKNRSRVEIIGNILGVARYGAKKTRITHRASLSNSQLQECVSLLTERGLLEEVNGRRGTGLLYQVGRAFNPQGPLPAAAAPGPPCRGVRGSPSG
jgi:predicted transcriptional regulator